MATQKNDSQTLPLDGVPKKRGRPSTGKALSNAQRQARHRAQARSRQLEFLNVAIGYFEGCSDDDIKSWLSPGNVGDSEYRAWLELGRRRGWLK